MTLSEYEAKYMTALEVAQMMNVSKRYVYQLIEKKKLDAIPFKGLLLILATEAKAFNNARR